MEVGTGGWAGGQACLPAIQMAIEDVNNNPKVLPGYALRLHQNNSKVSVQVSFIWLGLREKKARIQKKIEDKTKVERVKKEGQKEFDFDSAVTSAVEDDGRLVKLWKQLYLFGILVPIFRYC